MNRRTLDQNEGWTGVPMIPLRPCLAVLPQSGSRGSMPGKVGPCVPVCIPCTGSVIVLSMQMEGPGIIDGHRVAVDGHPMGVSGRMEAVGRFRLPAIGGVGTFQFPAVPLPIPIDLAADLDAHRC